MADKAGPQKKKDIDLTGFELLESPQAVDTAELDLEGFELLSETTNTNDSLDTQANQRLDVDPSDPPLYSKIGGQAGLFVLPDVEVSAKAPPQGTRRAPVSESDRAEAMDLPRTSFE